MQKRAACLLAEPSLPQSAMKINPESFFTNKNGDTKFFSFAAIHERIAS